MILKKVVGTNKVELKANSCHINDPLIGQIYILDGIINLSLNNSNLMPKDYYVDLWITEEDSGVVGADPWTYLNVGTKFK